MKTIILTIGHSRHSLDRFLALLEGAGANMIADVRSAPVSRFSPHFNKAGLSAALAARGIAYAFLGKELGGWPDRPELYTEGAADYEKMAAAPEFRAGLGRLMQEAEQRCVAAMCSEADPLDCHRCLLVGRALAESGTEVGHILPSGEIIAHRQVEDRLLHLANLAEPGLLLRSRDERLAEAYRLRCRKAAYRTR
ncbi:MAG TPA: DUF488 domain-containing protein [Methyloceanibacter sp.]|nr:DUF488 domain-containing protein [Methyloceanibacter sp.]